MSAAEQKGYSVDEGWRLLEVGEVVREGDQFLDPHIEEWIETSQVGRQAPYIMKYRRRVEQPQPAAQPEPQQPAPAPVQLEQTLPEVEPMAEVAKPTIDPGEGWRLLDKSESVIQGDEFYQRTVGEWFKSDNWRTNRQTQAERLIYRRRIAVETTTEPAAIAPTEPQPEPWPFAAEWAEAENLLNKTIAIAGRPAKVIGIDCKPPKCTEGVWLVLKPENGIGLSEYVRHDASGQSYAVVNEA